MNFTFGICTGGNNETLDNLIIDSVEKQNIPNYEIIIVGNCDISRKNTIVVPFDENVYPRWITKKKNIITQMAQYENIVYMHDYITLEPDWYQGFLTFGNDFKVCMTRMINLNGTRFRDWTLIYTGDPLVEGHSLSDRLLPYDILHLSKAMYISGAYWVAKKSIMEEFPLDEMEIWEDIEWSHRFRMKNDFSMNPHSSVKLLKQVEKCFNEIPANIVEKLRHYNPPIRDPVARREDGLSAGLRKYD